MSLVVCFAPLKFACELAKHRSEGNPVKTPFRPFCDFATINGLTDTCNT